MHIERRERGTLVEPKRYPDELPPPSVYPLYNDDGTAWGERIVMRMLAICIVFLLAASLLALAFYIGYVYRGVVGGL